MDINVIFRKKDYVPDKNYVPDNETQNKIGNVIKYFDPDPELKNKGFPFFMTTNNNATMIYPNHISQIVYKQFVSSNSYDKYTYDISGSKINVDKYMKLGYNIVLGNENENEKTIELFITDPTNKKIETETFNIIQDKKSTFTEFVFNLTIKSDSSNGNKGGKKRSSKKTQKKSTSNKRKTIKKSKKSKMTKRK